MDAKDVGSRIEFFRLNKGLNKNELANLAGVSPTYIYQLEQGLKSPTVVYLEYICFGLGITLEEFFKTDEKLKDNIDNLTYQQRELLDKFLKSL